MTAVTVLERRIKPLLRYRIRVPQSRTEFSAACFAGKDWSLKDLKVAGDALVHSKLADKVGSALYGLGVSRAYAPSPTEFNAKIVEPGHLRNIIPLPQGVSLYRNTDKPAEGVPLSTNGDAATFSGGGCGMVVMSSKRKLVVAHAGRDSLIDRTWMMTRGARHGRQYMSVIDPMIEMFDTDDVSDIHVWLFWFIKPEDFLHRFDEQDDRYRVYNYALGRLLPVMYSDLGAEVTEKGVYLDLPRIARGQALLQGIPDENIHLEHCYLADELPHTRKGGGRYLAAVVRHS